MSPLFLFPFKGKELPRNFGLDFGGYFRGNLRLPRFQNFKHEVPPESTVGSGAFGVSGPLRIVLSYIA
jgi:hypothetical protein